MQRVKLFITGVGGTTGRALAKIAAFENYNLGGTFHHNIPQEITELKNRGLLKLYHVDLRTRKPTKNALQDFRPDFIIHLAGKVLGGLDKQVLNPRIYDENLTIFRNVLNAVKEVVPSARFVLSSGCLVYNKLSFPTAITEADVTDLPEIDVIKEPYRASKLDQERLLTKSNLDYIIARPTQFTGPGKIPGVVEYFIAKEILEIKDGEKKDIIVKNKLGEVDILDVRDIARAYLTLIEEGISRQIYHISSGSPTSVEQVAKLLLEISGLNPKKYQIISTDTEQTIYFRFSSAKLNQLGWKPQYTLKDALTSYWKYFKNQKN